MSAEERAPYLGFSKDTDAENKETICKSDEIMTDDDAHIQFEEEERHIYTTLWKCCTISESICGLLEC